MQYFSKFSLLLGTIVMTFVSLGHFGIAHAANAAVVGSPFLYEFRIDGTVNESGSMNISSSPYWWVNSGGQMWLSGGKGKTIQGDASVNNPWRAAYLSANPVDTDNGLHPQNIFRLVTRNQWQNAQEEIKFKINRYNLSASPNRAEHNGVLLFNRYEDSQNLYYTGIRVDGKAIIKKKKNGIYYTLASRQVYNGTYSRTNNPNLIPVNTWIGLRSKLVNNPDGSVTIQLYMDTENNGTWILVAEARDDGQSYGGTAITNSGYGGLRTDFMDIEFDDFRFRTL